jgi:hypothetical protein
MIDDVVLESDQFGIEFLRPLGVKALVGQMNQATMISHYDKFSMLQVRAPVINYN